MSRTLSLRGRWDVVYVVGILVLLNAVLLTPAGNPVRILMALLTLLFVPGYALTTALFPERRLKRRTEPASLLDPTETVLETVSQPTRAGLTDGERVALSFGLSLAMIPIYGFLVEVVWGGYALVSVVVTLTVSVLVLLLVGLYRGAQVSPASATRFDGLHPGGALRWIVAKDPRHGDVDGITPQGLSNRRSELVSYALGIAVIVSVVTFGIAIATPSGGAEYTEAYLATENGGNLTAMNYPTEPGADDSSELVLVVENHEGRQVDYSAVVTLERVPDEGEPQTVRTLDRFSETLDPGEEWRRAHTLDTDESGPNLRVAYLIYRGEPPATPTRANAYRNLTLWIGSSAA